VSNVNVEGGRTLIGGVDEAGRGPVIGPMVLACVVCERDRLSSLVALGVRDSKSLTPARRERLYKHITGLALEVGVKVVGPKEIDESVGTHFNLNRLEAKVTADLIRSLKHTPSLLYVDSPDPVARRYGELLTRLLEERGIKGLEVIADNRADRKYVVVSAASVVAKVVRDRIIEGLKRFYGDFGSGYPSDPRTLSFLRSWTRTGRLPPIVRRSWATLKKLSRAREGEEKHF